IKPSDLILRRPRSSRGRLEGWPLARPRPWPSFETPTFGRLLRTRLTVETLCSVVASKSRFRLQRREPRPGRLFGPSADLGRLLSGKLVEIGIAIAASFGDEVPFDRFGRIERCAMANAQQTGEAVLGNRATAQSSLAEQRRRLGLILGDAGAVE